MTRFFKLSGSGNDFIALVEAQRQPTAAQIPWHNTAYTGTWRFSSSRAAMGRNAPFFAMA